MLAPSVARAYDPEPLAYRELQCAYPTSPWPDFVGPIWLGDAARAPDGPAAHRRTTTRLVCEAEAPEAISYEATAQSAPLGVDDATRALRAARALAEAGRHREAVLQARQLAEAAPALSDRAALLEGDYRMAAGPSEAACDAYARAMEGPQRTVALRARLGWVRCLLETDHPDGPDELTALSRRYPELPQRPALELALAARHDRQGEREEAGALYRRIDLLYPGSPVAREARARAEALRAEGVDVRPLSLNQQVDRAERLVRSGPMDQARAEVTRLRGVELPQPLGQQLARSAARMARVEGRWEDASRLLREARGLPALEEEEREAMSARIQDLERAAESREEAEVRRRLRGMRRGRSYARTGTARLFAILRLAARAQLVDVVDEVLEAIRDRDRVPPGLRFDAALLAAGTGSDAHIEALFGSAAGHPIYGVAARYHRARTLERLGRSIEAAREYAQVLEEDSETLPYYAMWARQRLRAMREASRPSAPVGVPAVAEACEQGPICAPLGVDGLLLGGAKTGVLPPTPPLASPPPNPFREQPPAPEPGDDLDLDATGEPVALELEASLTEAPEGVVPDVGMTPEQIREALAPVAEAYGEAFPWVERARLLVRMGEPDAAADELHEVYTAWRDATGRGSLRAGLAGVLRGGAPRRHRVSRGTWAQRRRLSSDARDALARASAALGDYGLAIRFSGGFALTGPRPFAYEDLVRDAARRHGVEPELLHAVMRVESVYNPRIISYAGAIGLMQIMPRTGRLIAASLGRDDFTVDQLLDPATNIEFAAWYLASLIERWDGRLPLAIASYNGGPHNVRRWMRDYSPDLPLDAFLERIEFSQTHRYVRRVLTHYEAYRAQRDLAPQALAVTLPEPRPDRVAF